MYNDDGKWDNKLDFKNLSSQEIYEYGKKHFYKYVIDPDSLDKNGNKKIKQTVKEHYKFRQDRIDKLGYYYIPKEIMNWDDNGKWDSDKNWDEQFKK